MSVYVVLRCNVRVKEKPHASLSLFFSKSPEGVIKFNIPIQWRNFCLIILPNFTLKEKFKISILSGIKPGTAECAAGLCSCTITIDSISYSCVTLNLKCSALCEKIFFLIFFGIATQDLEDLSEIKLLTIVIIAISIVIDVKHWIQIKLQ